MKKIIYIILLTSLSLNSQSRTISELRSNGNYHLAKKNYQIAKECYLKILDLDSLNSNAYSGLGLIALETGEKDKACSLLNKSYKLKNNEIGHIIIQYCGSIDYAELMYTKDIDEYPKFNYKGKYNYIADKDKSVHPNFSKEFKKAIENSEILKEFKEFKNEGKIKGYKNIDLLLNVRFDKDGLFIGDVYVNNGKKRIKEITQEVTIIINNSFEIVPAKYQNNNVGTWDGFLIGISI